MKIEIDEVDFSEIKKTLEWYRLLEEGRIEAWPKGVTIPKATAMLKYLNAKYQYGLKQFRLEK